MTDETKDQTGAEQAPAPDVSPVETPAEAPVDAAAVVVTDESGAVQAEALLAVQGTHALLVARFADMDSAKAAYEALRDAEARRAIDVEGVLVANADYEGKVNIQKMTDHKTRNGFLWGAVGGAALAIIFPPTIIAGAIGVGIAGAAIGKARNIKMKHEVAEELSSVITPGTSGIIALVSITAVDAVKATIPQAEEVKAVPIDDETAQSVKAAAKAAGDEAPAS
jgi:uncharacterized membrane protein